MPPRARVRGWHVLLAMCVIAAGWAIYKKTNAHPERETRQINGSVIRAAQPQVRSKDVTVMKPLPTNQATDVVKLRKQFLAWNNCAQALVELKYLIPSIDQCGAVGKKQAQLLQCDPPVRAEQMLRVNKVRDSMAECGDYNEIDKKYYEATRAAALAGDVDAQLCYVQSAFSDDTDNEHQGHYTYTDNDRALYTHYAPQMIDAATKRGDWRIVAIMASARRLTTSSGLFGEIPGIDSPEQLYKTTYLLSLGATDGYADMLKGRLLDYALSQEERDRAITWATQAYQSYFVNSAKLSESPIPCGDYRVKDTP